MRWCISPNSWILLVRDSNPSSLVRRGLAELGMPYLGKPAVIKAGGSGIPGGSSPFTFECLYSSISHQRPLTYSRSRRQPSGRNPTFSKTLVDAELEFATRSLPLLVYKLLLKLPNLGLGAVFPRIQPEIAWITEAKPVCGCSQHLLPQPSN